MINLSTSLFSSLIPVPGGIGVVEGGLVVGLSSGGMTQSAAFATVLLYRICDVLPAADLGLVRAALAPPQPVPLKLPQEAVPRRGDIRLCVRTASLHPRNSLPKPLAYNG